MKIQNYNINPQKNIDFSRETLGLPIGRPSFKNVNISQNKNNTFYKFSGKPKHVTNVTEDNTLISTDYYPNGNIKEVTMLYSRGYGKITKYRHNGQIKEESRIFSYGHCQETIQYNRKNEVKNAIRVFYNGISEKLPKDFRFED